MISAVILAGGRGERFGSTIPKPFMSLNGKKVIDYSIEMLEKYVDEIVIVSQQKYKNYTHAQPGSTRQKSVHNGLKKCSNPDFVIVHDAVRPFLTEEMMEGIIRALDNGSKCVDTAVNVLDGLLFNGVPLDKRGFMLSQTPEAFDYQMLLDAHESAMSDDSQDDVSLFHEKYNIEPTIVDGVYLNTKITFGKDLENAEAVMKFWQKPTDEPYNNDVRVLLFGGSGGIGGALKGFLNHCCAPTREEIDLSKDFTIDNIQDYDTIVHCVAEYEDDDKIMQVNFNSFVSLVKYAESVGWKGNIVVLSSTAAIYGRPSIPLYSASKSALNTYIEARHDDLAQKGIFVNAIAPAKVNTRLQEVINPDAKKESMLSPEYVAQRILPYLTTKEHGHIIYIRNGFAI